MEISTWLMHLFSLVDRSDHSNQNRKPKYMNNYNQSHSEALQGVLHGSRGRASLGAASNRRSASLLDCASNCAAVFRHKITSALTTEFAETLSPRFVRQVVNEADALASTTPYRGLLFPLLAEEKARTASAWATRQQRLLQQTIQFGA